MLYCSQTLLDAQRRAEHTYDLDPLNLYVGKKTFLTLVLFMLIVTLYPFLLPSSSPEAESYVGKGTYLKRIRYHGKGMAGLMHKYYAHYFLKLREGPPLPKKKRRKEDHKSFVTQKLIKAGPRSIPNSL